MEMARDAAAFEQFVKRSRTSLRLVATSICGEWHAADDLVQETLVILHRRWTDIEPEARDAYARTVMAHLNMRGHASARWRHESPGGVISEQAAPACEEDNLANRLMLGNALRSLPARQRNAVYLRFWEGLSTGEIALALNAPGGTVRSDLTRAMAQLRRTLSASIPLHPARRLGHDQDT